MAEQETLFLLWSIQFSWGVLEFKRSLPPIQLMPSPTSTSMCNNLLDTYHWKYPTLNSTLMYLLGTVCCQHIHRSQIWCGMLICTLWYGLIILISTLGFDLSVHLCWKPNIEYKCDVLYFQRYVSMTLFNAGQNYPLESGFMRKRKEME